MSHNDSIWDENRRIRTVHDTASSSGLWDGNEEGPSAIITLKCCSDKPTKLLFVYYNRREAAQPAHTVIDRALHD